MTGDLVGREREATLVRAFLDRAAQEPAGLLLLGEAGIGKTVIWQKALESAHGRVGTVLTCRGVEAEATLAFSALGVLVGDAMTDVLDSLPGPRRRALEVALMLAEPEHRQPDLRGVGLAVLDVLRAISRTGPLVIAIDDLHWLDDASTRVLAYALRRLRDEPIGVLGTARSRAGQRARTPQHLETLPFLEQATVGPLSLSATYQLVRSRLNLRLPRPQLVRLHEVTGGNPLFAIEVGREMVESAAAGHDKPLPVTGSLRDLLGRRLARLAVPTTEVLVAVAASARPTRRLLDAVTGDAGIVREALREAAAADVLAPEQDSIRFTHPLLASVCYQNADTDVRAGVHRRLAGVADDDEERARHLALGADGPDGQVAAALEAAAAHAARRGATATAAELLELAVSHTPSGEPDTGRDRELRAAEHHRLAGDPARARSILEGLFDRVPSGPIRADVLLALARVERSNLPAVVGLCDQALEEAGADDKRAATILTYLSWIRMLQADIRRALADARAALGRAERVGDPVLIARAIARVAMSETWTLQVTPDLLERGIAIEESLGYWLELHSSPRWTLARRLTCLDELDRARTLMEAAEGAAVERGDEETRALILFFLSALEIHAGRWRRAQEYITAGLELAEQLDDQQLSGMMSGAQADLDIVCGRIEAAREGIAHSLAISDVVEDTLLRISKLDSAGFLELSAGNLAAAAGHLRPLPQLLLSHGWNQPMMSSAWQHAIEALIGVGELTQAGTYLEAYEKRARKAAAPSAIAIAARCRALLAAASGNIDDALEWSSEALRRHERAARPFERARTQLLVGAIRRRARQKRAAREALRSALLTFESLGALLWADRARDELARVGGRRSGDGLTDTEQRMAALAAQGLSNKEIAAAAFVSVHTVEIHLSSVYRKLGLRSRTELAARAAASADNI
jgi:DNA-binding CsgD family transcriptional regulator